MLNVVGPGIMLGSGFMFVGMVPDEESFALLFVNPGFDLAIHEFG